MKKILIYTVHKAGSMFLHKLTNNIAKELYIDYYSINDNKIHDEIEVYSWNAFIENNLLTGCFGPIRGGEAVPSIPDNLDMYSIAVHMRDPRDVLTSLYYSMTYSHGSREGGFQFTEDKRKVWQTEGIDRFVLKMTTKFKYRYEYLCSSLIGKDGVKLLRYEDMITDFGGWLENYLSVFSHCGPKKKNIFGLVNEKSNMRKLYKKTLKEYSDEFNIVNEDVYSHKRQIVAGDHKRKLKPETINRLNDEFNDILNLLGYVK
jgi:sulfotransferase family protein